MSSQTKKMNDTPGPAEALQNALDKGVSTLQDTIFGPGTSTQPTQSQSEQSTTPSDPRLQQAPKESIEEAIRDQHRSGPPKELLKEANSEKREQERKKEEQGDEGKA